ncbi:MAG: hypothetical protein LBT14_12820 [Treponema sp.]|jgi:hypothetical protein|nr:hypothetical protein [Treponema sp.]
MNQDQVKTALLSIENSPLDFTLIFSGKLSKKINGLYKPETREIIIHNRNFSDDNLLLYTAIHEYAHHLHACFRGGTLSTRAHTADFWAILHRLLEKAEAQGLYKNVFAASPELAELTETIRTRYLYENGNIVKDLGMHLLRAHELCVSIGGRFEDYIDRVLRIPRTAANMAVKMYQYNLNPSIGSDNMRFLAGIKNVDERMSAEASLLKGKSPDTVRIEAKRRTVGSQPPEAEDPKLRLEKEKIRLERTIASLSKRLDEVERELGQC